MVSRRQFIKLAGSSAGLLMTACQSSLLKSARSARVVIIGGGFAGVTVAKTIKQLDARIRVTLIEPKQRYIACPTSNWVIAGFKSIESLTFSYDRLAKNYGIEIIHAAVIKVAADKKQVQLNTQQWVSYDRLIVSAGIDFQWDAIAGYNQASSAVIPHAWQAGQQTLLLRDQLRAMPDGGTIIMTVPPNPFRCPPGPYERASLIAYYLKKYKPKSKLLILDAKSHFSKQSQFIHAWETLYGYGTDHSLIEWLPLTDNQIIHMDVTHRQLTTDFGDTFTADVLNHIPAQTAGKIAHSADLVDSSGWCSINHQTSESNRYPFIHIIGDAAAYHPLPKSAFAANSEAKMCAFAIVSLLNDMPLHEPTWINVCYSLINPRQGISVTMVYRLNQQGLVIKVKGAGGVTASMDDKTLFMEAIQAKHWFQTITQDSFG